MTIQVDHSVVIDRPVKEVFEYVTSVENHENWHVSVTDSTPKDDEMGEGTTWTLVYDLPWGTTEIVDKCTAYEPPNRFGYYTTDGVFGGRFRNVDAEYIFTPEGESTRVSYSTTTEVKGIARLLKPLLAKMVEDEVKSQLEELQSLLE